MRFVAVALPGLAVLLQAAGAVAADQRPALRGVSAIRIANYGSPSVLLEGRDKVRAVVGELNALRSKAWLGGDTKLSCYATMVVFSGKQTLGTFRITSETIVEREGAKGQPIFSRSIDAGDIPALSMLLGEIAPAKGCD